MNIIKGRKLSYDYFRVDEDGKEEEAVRAVDQVDLDVKEGDFVAILGQEKIWKKCDSEGHEPAGRGNGERQKCTDRRT